MCHVRNAVVTATLLGSLLGAVGQVEAGGSCPCPGAGLLLGASKVASSTGGFNGPLDNSDLFGSSITSIGDLDGDSVPDLAVGSPFDDDGAADRGAVWILLMNANGSVKSQQKISGTSGGFTGALDVSDLFGSSVASLGDLDGDGTVDLAVGAVNDDDGGVDRGAVWILFLKPNGTVKSHVKIASSTGGFSGTLHTADAFGASIAPLADVNGDGNVDLAVGATFDDDGGPDRGAVWILFLNPNGTVSSQQKISSIIGGFSGQLDTSDHFGASVASAGDLDGNGTVDIAVGAPLDDDGGTDRGAMWLVYLTSSGVVSTQKKISSTTGGFTGQLDNNDSFGISVTSLGDIDGDQVADLAVGAMNDDDGGPDRGAAWVLFPNADGSMKSHQKISSIVGGLPRQLHDSDAFGFSVARLGDLNADGTTDLAVGANRDDQGGLDRGAVWTLVLLGCSWTPAPVGDFTNDCNVDGADLAVLLGAWAGPGGDLNGDGTTDGADLAILLGAWTG